MALRLDQLLVDRFGRRPLAAASPDLMRVGAGFFVEVGEPGLRRLSPGLNAMPVELPALAILPTLAPFALLAPPAVQLREPPAATPPIETPCPPVVILHLDLLLLVGSSASGAF